MPARVAWLDSARALMLVLGVPFHASEMYRLSGGWRVASPDVSFAATLFGALVHAFRMPAFFVLAGLFAATLVERRGDGPWLCERARRLGVPLVATTLGFGWLESAIARAHREGLGLGEAVVATFDSSPTDWTHHRWFLFVLLLHCLTAVALRRWGPANGATRALGALWPGAGMPVALVAALVAWPFAVAGLDALAGGAGLDGGPDAANFYLRYAPFFALGYAAARADGSLERLLRLGRGEGALAALAIGLYVATYAGFRPGGAAGDAGSGAALARTGVDALAGFYAARLALAGARRWLDAPSPAVDLLVRSALAVYLVHELFVLWLGAALARVALPPTLEIALVSVGSLALSLGAFALSRRSATLSLALSGTRTP